MRSSSELPFLTPVPSGPTQPTVDISRTVNFTRKVPRSQLCSSRHTCASGETSPKSATAETSSGTCVTIETFRELPREGQESRDEKIEEKKSKIPTFTLGGT